jgi:hypothetical protein
MSEFSRTRMGRKFYETDIPKLATVLERIATQMEKANLLEEKKFKLDEKLQKFALREAKNKS